MIVTASPNTEAIRSAMTEPNIPLPTTTYFVSIISDSVFKKIVKKTEIL